MRTMSLVMLVLSRWVVGVAYQQIEALQSVLIVSHRRRCLTVVSRTPDGWVSRDFEAGTTAQLAGPVPSLAVDEVYATLSAL
jgi:hypothetical protein